MCPSPPLAPLLGKVGKRFVFAASRRLAESSVASALAQVCLSSSGRRKGTTVFEPPTPEITNQTPGSFSRLAFFNVERKPKSSTKIRHDLSIEEAFLCKRLIEESVWLVLSGVVVVRTVLSSALQLPMGLAKAPH